MLGAISNHDEGMRNFVLKSPTDNWDVEPVLDVAVMTVALLVTLRDVIASVWTSGRLNAVATSR